jgi:negative regulator of flagellin synthesis FlgM
MRVDAPLPLPENLQPQKVERSGSSTNQSRLASVESNQDKAQLSVNSERIEQLKAALSRVPEVRQERVDALRQALGKGSYQVTDQQLADAIHSELQPGGTMPHLDLRREESWTTWLLPLPLHSEPRMM